MFVRCPGCQAAYRLEAEQIPAAGLRVRCPGCGNVFRVRGVESAPLVALATPAPGVERPTNSPARRTRPAAPQSTEAPPAGMAQPQSSASASPLDLERDDRRPPRVAPPPRLPTQRVTPRPVPGVFGPPSTPTPIPRRPQWQGERTLELGSTGSTSAPPRLETAPFKPGLPPISPAPRPHSGSEVATPTAPAAAHERARRLARALVSDILVYNQSARDRALQQGNLASALGGEVNKAWDMYKAKVDADVLRSTSYFKDALNDILADGQIVF